MGLFDQLRKSDEKVARNLNEQRLGYAEQNVARARNEARQAETRGDAAYNSAMDTAHMFADQRDQALEELAEARRIIETLRMESRMINVISNSLASGLERATLDVAQLTGIAPHVVQGRYQAAVIDNFRSNTDRGVLPINTNSTWGNTDIAGRFKKYLINSMILDELKAKWRSHQDAYMAVLSTSKKINANILDVKKAFKWLRNDPTLISKPLAEVMSEIKPLDDAMIVAINLNSKITPAGSALHSIARDGTQSATRFYDGLKGGGATPYFSVHTELQQASKWRMDTEMYKAFSAAEDESNASGLLKYLSKVAGVDVSDNSAVKPAVGSPS